MTELRSVEHGWRERLAGGWCHGMRFFADKQTANPKKQSMPAGGNECVPPCTPGMLQALLLFCEESVAHVAEAHMA